MGCGTVPCRGVCPSMPMAPQRFSLPPDPTSSPLNKRPHACPQETPAFLNSFHHLSPMQGPSAQGMGNASSDGRDLQGGHEELDKEPVSICHVAVSHCQGNGPQPSESPLPLKSSLVLPGCFAGQDTARPDPDCRKGFPRHDITHKPRSRYKSPLQSGAANDRLSYTQRGEGNRISEGYLGLLARETSAQLCPNIYCPHCCAQH